MQPGNLVLTHICPGIERLLKSINVNILTKFDQNKAKVVSFKVITSQNLTTHAAHRKLNDARLRTHVKQAKNNINDEVTVTK